MSTPRIDGDTFLTIVRPALSRCDAPALAQAIKARWCTRDVLSMLHHDCIEVRRVATTALGLVGDQSCAGSLTRVLHDDDWQLNELAENALWSIWFRSGAPEATQPFCRGVSMMAKEKYADAIVCFDEATRVDGQFAEAYNQCAIAHFLLSQWRDSLNHSRRAIEIVPCHFGAFAGLGHVYVELGHLEKAVQAYRRAVRINPRMATIAHAIERLETTLRERRDSSGLHHFDRSL
jgi:tetratricopeptide (TPR) repeat protein